MGTSDLGELKAYLDQRKAVVDRALESCFPQGEGPDRDLIAAMRYSLFAGGKRLRPILCLAGASAVGGKEPEVLPVACALELIHTYSLIHDDLPAMDDDDLRRGRPTNHKVFGEAVAILAGDGLLTEAFTLLAQMPFGGRVPAGALLDVIALISRAAGYRGMVGGQVVDIQSQGKPTEFDTVEFIHTRKTGALLAASVTSGAILGGGDTFQIQAIRDYGEKIGLAFQISDDILDIEGDPNVMGKRPGVDAQKGKATYPAIVGLDRAKDIQTELVKGAIQSLTPFDFKADPLRWIAAYIVERKK
jgi:geranylgeranyl diphosphate synthase, type II